MARNQSWQERLEKESVPPKFTFPSVATSTLNVRCLFTCSIYLFTYPKKNYRARVRSVVAFLTIVFVLTENDGKKWRIFSVQQWSPTRFKFIYYSLFFLLFFLRLCYSLFLEFLVSLHNDRGDTSRYISRCTRIYNYTTFLDTDARKWLGKSMNLQFEHWWMFLIQSARCLTKICNIQKIHLLTFGWDRHFHMLSFLVFVQH